MRSCDNCEYGSYGLDCSSGVETLYCRENEYEHEVKPTDVCDVHKFIDGYKNEEILGYDCDGNEISEFRILRFPFSAYIENWDEEPNIDPRFYCLVRSSNGMVYGISVYDYWHKEDIRRYEEIGDDVDIPVIIKSEEELSYYEVAVDCENKPFYYEGDKLELRKMLDNLLKSKKMVRKK
jgi:hypothetical protein